MIVISVGDVVFHLSLSLSSSLPIVIVVVFVVVVVVNVAVVVVVVVVVVIVVAVGVVVVGVIVSVVVVVVVQHLHAISSRALITKTSATSGVNDFINPRTLWSPGNWKIFSFHVSPKRKNGIVIHFD